MLKSEAGYASGAERLQHMVLSVLLASHKAMFSASYCPFF